MAFFANGQLMGATGSAPANMREFRALPLPAEVFEKILDRTPAKVFWS